MHVILVTMGSAGDLFPFLWIGRALRERGHPLIFSGPTCMHPMSMRLA